MPSLLHLLYSEIVALYLSLFLAIVCSSVYFYLVLSLSTIVADQRPTTVSILSPWHLSATEHAVVSLSLQLSKKSATHNEISWENLDQKSPLANVIPFQPYIVGSPIFLNSVFLLRPTLCFAFLFIIIYSAKITMEMLPGHCSWIYNLMVE